LPSVSQWNKAGGARNGATGPFRADWQPGEIAVNRGRDGPMPAGSATADMSIFGCRDMAGNGEEWTHNLLNLETEGRVPVKKPGPDLRVRTRGASYLARRPFEFLDDDTGDSKSYFQALPDVSFRVAVEAR
jgi:formylglycine-generating enzyme required for sulfatase activity